MSSTVSLGDEIDWSTEVCIEVSTLLSGRTFSVPIRAARHWNIFNKYFSGATVDSTSTFVFPHKLEEDETIIPLIIEFSKLLCEINIAHIPGPLLDARNLMEPPYNVPKWAFDWIVEKELPQVFALLEAAHELQMSQLVELCAATLALTFISFTMQDRHIVSGHPEGLSQEKLETLMKIHADWANSDKVEPVSYE